MGGNQSKDADAADCVGYRVLGVQPDSPASKGGLVSFFDFILAANGHRLNILDATFINIINEFEDRDLTLTVYNFKARNTRTVVLKPTRNWGGGSRDGMLGVTIKFDTYLDAEECLCHVLGVEPDSPAELAGLVAESDYLLGTAEMAYKDTEVLLESLMAYLDQPMEIYVYSKLTDEVRSVVLMPTAMGREGRGVLGADVAHGILHTLPQACCNTIGKTAIPSNIEEGSLYINQALESTDVDGSGYSVSYSGSGGLSASGVDIDSVKSNLFNSSTNSSSSDNNSDKQLVDGASVSGNNDDSKYTTNGGDIA